MPPIKTILVPTDFSAASKQALRYARDVADAFGASLHILHVLENPFMAITSAEIFLPPPGEYLEELERRTRTSLEGQLTAEEKARYSAVFALRMGSPANEILEYVNERGDIDLVIMATAGRGGVARLLMGSVADRVVRSAPCPVLTLHPPEIAETGSTSRAA